MNRKTCSVMLLAGFVMVLLIVSAPYQASSQWRCKLEDVSPGPGSTAGDGDSLWGKMLTVAATGLEGAVGPPTSWSTPNNGVIVDHVAAADKDGHLVLFYSYPGSDWKAANVMEKTNAIIDMVRPESWVFPDGENVLERLAAPSPSGDLLLFTWHTRSDWTVTNLTTPLQKKIAGAVTSWQTPLGDRMVEHIGARGIDNHFLVFWRIAGGDWAVVDVTDLTGGQQVGDSGASWTQNLGSEWLESVAIPDPTGDLILFTFRPSTNWQAQNLSQATNSKQKVGGAAVHWTAPTGLRIEYLAAPAPNGDLVLFYTELIDHGWGVLNITGITGQRVTGPVANWSTGGGGAWWEHLAGRGTNDHLYVFSRPTGGTWQVKDVTGVVNQTITQAPTAWITAKGSYSGENVAAPSWDGHMHIFTFDPSSDWRKTDVSLRAYGRIVYAASEMAGVWRSRDYGTNWAQMTRPQPLYAEQTTGGLDVHIVLDIAASPSDPNLVLAATGADNRNPSLTGVYRSTDAGETWKLVHQFKCGSDVQPVTQILFAPGDPKTIYAAGGCAIAVSKDGGSQWDEIAPTEVAANRRIWHLAVSPELTGELRHGYACGDNTLWYFSHSSLKLPNWRTTWKWHIDTATATALPAQFCGQTTSTPGDGAQVLAIDPENPKHVYLAIWNHANGPSYYHPVDGGPQGVLANIPVVYDANNIGKYATSMPLIWPKGYAPPLPPVDAQLTHDQKLRFVDLPPYNGHWDIGETVVYDADDEKQFKGENQQVLAGDKPDVGTKLLDDSAIKYVGVGNRLGPRGAGEGSLWFGDFSGFDPSKPGALKGAWENLPGPPIYFGGSTDSGTAFVFTHKTKDGYLVFFSNRESVHVSVGKPIPGGWHRLGARDASESKREDDLKNVLYVHVDPHGLAVTPDFELSLVPSNQSDPYNQNMELKRPYSPTTANLPVKETCRGRIWLSNDGGVYRSDDCGQQWAPALSGLSTLASHNIAGLAQGSTSSGGTNKPPALYFGTGDNDDFFSTDGGKTWRYASGNCGDCDVWYADPAQPDRLWRHPPRNSGKHAFALIANLQVLFGPPMVLPLLLTSGPPEPTPPFLTVDYPDPPSGSQWAVVGGEGGNEAYRAGSRPIVQTLASEAPLTNGDYIHIQEIRPPAPALPRRVLIRAKDSILVFYPSNQVIASWAQVGPDLPASASIVQASGGHAATVFYAGDETSLWRWPRNDGSTIDQWQQIVPGGGATRATRFFVNPYDSNDIYILDQNTVRHSSNGGALWAPDTSLDVALTDGGYQPGGLIGSMVAGFQRQCNGSFCVLNDMIFDRNSPKIRFALGLAGVFYSGDGGLQWWRLLDTHALPSRPRGAFFDPITDPKDRSLYIALEGRGIMRCHPVPEQLP